jgi:hypothetical protein
MASNSKVGTKNIDDMIKITAGYVKLGIEFTVSYHDDIWWIKLTGGY